MPSFTTITLDRLLEPGASKSVDKSVSSSNPITKPKGLPKAKPGPHSNVERRQSIATTDKKANHLRISPALYATSEARPVPGSPTAFPPSPYIVNHKWRGAGLLKSFSEDPISSCKKELDKENVNGSAKIAEAEDVDSTKGDGSVSFSIGGERMNGVEESPLKGKVANVVHHSPVVGEHVNGIHDEKIGDSNEELGSSNDTSKDLVPLDDGKDGEYDDFFDPQESMSYTSNTDAEDNTGAESSVQLVASTQMGEFYDAWEELSSEGGPQPSASLHDTEAELRGMRLSLLMEIENRKQAEDSLNNMQIQWQRIRQQLTHVGLTLPAWLIDATEGDQLLDVNPAEELCQQVYLARFVSDAIGRGIAKAELEVEMEAQIDAKNFEIARLWDRLHYYEATNREMTQRNQEAVEMARRKRHLRKRRQSWVWGSVAAAFTFGIAALAWSYLPARGSASTSGSPAPEPGDTTF